MRIAIFSDNFYPELSGVSDSLLTTAVSLAKRGHVVRIYAPKYSAKNFSIAKLPCWEIDLGENISICRLSSLPFPTGTKQSRLVIPFGRALGDVKKFKPDIIHTHQFFGTGIEALLCAKFLKIPLVGTNHTAITEFVRYAPIKAKWVEKLSLKYVNWYYGRCDFVTAPSNSVIEEMENAGFSIRSQIVSNPIDPDAFNDFAEGINSDREDLKKKFGLNAQTVVYAGRFAPEKNIEVIVKAVAEVKKKRPEIMLAMAGHGVSLNAIRELGKKLGLEKNMKFIGTLNRFELADLYRASELFVITSKSETQSMTLIQAMACGLPVIGVRARALPEYINEKNGILTKPDDYQALAESILELLGNQEKRERLGLGGKELAANFSAEKIAQTWENIYAWVLEGHREEMKLSIVIPAYNEEKYLGNCLEAIKMQLDDKKYSIEIVVVNNASTDRTGELARSFSSVIVVDELQKGLVKARSAGYRATTGQLIANIDADTQLTDGWIEKVFREFARDKSLVALSGPYKYNDLSKSKMFLVSTWYRMGQLLHFFNQFILRKGAMLQGGNFVLHRDALEKIGGFDVSIDFYGEDTDIARRISKVGKVKFTFNLPMYTSARRFRGEGFLRMGWKYLINHFWILFFKKPFTKKFIDIRE